MLWSLAFSIRHKPTQIHIKLIPLFWFEQIALQDCAAQWLVLGYRCAPKT
uniref:Uncharacterized protein n=1 Tax=Rhizophora mucronata TaxID=61149 RepID=A0A2P2ILP7_RHIMU